MSTASVCVILTNLSNTKSGTKSLKKLGLKNGNIRGTPEVKKSGLVFLISGRLVSMVCV